MTDQPENIENLPATGTSGGGTSWRSFPDGAPEGAHLVYVAVPNEDTLEMVQRRAAFDIEVAPRVQALNAALSLNQQRYGENTTAEVVIRDAAKFEAYLSRGEVPAETTATEEGSTDE